LAVRRACAREHAAPQHSSPQCSNAHAAFRNLSDSRSAETGPICGLPR